MGYAIEMFFDAASELRLYSLWDEFSTFGASSMRDGESRPHVSLAVADAVDLPATRQLLDSFARTAKPFSLSLASLGLFPCSERIAYLAPKVTPELLALHGRFFDRFSSVASGIWQLYAPATWVPHCTLAIGLLPQQLVPAVDACQAFGLPLACTVAEVGLVEFHPAKQLQAVPFAA